MAAWFFTEEEIETNKYIITGENAKHIKVLRMKNGEELTLVTPLGIQHECKIADVNQTQIEVDVSESHPCENEPDVFVTLYQALPKGDKMDYIVQKCVELGVSKIVPVMTARCVSRPDEKSLKKKIARWQKIALQAAMQSRRGIIGDKIGNCFSVASLASEFLRYEDRVGVVCHHKIQFFLPKIDAVCQYRSTQDCCFCQVKDPIQAPHSMIG